VAVQLTHKRTPVDNTYTEAHAHMNDHKQQRLLGGGVSEGGRGVRGIATALQPTALCCVCKQGGMHVSMLGGGTSTCSPFQSSLAARANRYIQWLLQYVQ
jgi:hypothetical protein